MKKTLFALLISGLVSFGAVSSGVSVSTVSRTSNVVTVTCSAACGIAANQGFVLSGVTDSTFNVNSTAVTGSGTTFTFNQTGSNGSSSGGTVLPAKQIIILTTIPFSINNVVPATTGITVNGLFWITTQNGVPTPGNSAWTGASTAEKNALAAGTTIEQTFSFQYNSAESKAQIQSDLQTKYSTAQATQANSTVQPGQFLGGYFDSTGWSF